MTIDEKKVAQEFAASVDSVEYPAGKKALVEALTPDLERYYEQWDLDPFDPYIIYNSRT